MKEQSKMWQNGIIVLKTFKMVEQYIYKGKMTEYCEKNIKRYNSLQCGQNGRIV